MTNLANHRVRFGPFQADLATRELWRNGIRLKLSGQPFQILIALLENPGQLVSREDLRKRIWTQDTFVDFSHGLNAAVNKLREALCDSPEQPRYIETLPRRGYRFIAKVEKIEEKQEQEVARPIEAQPTSPRVERIVPSSQPTAPLPAPLRHGSSTRASLRSSVTAKRQTLVSLAALLAGSLLLVVGLARVGLHLYGYNASEIAERAMKLAAEKQTSRVPGIYHLDVAHAPEELARTRIINGQEAIGGPQPSPDEKKLVFMSGRTDNMEIWVSNIDGSSPRKLTNMGTCGTPRWSPDSQWIAFDSDSRFGHSGIYVVSANGGPVRAVVQDQWDNAVPSWSRDGQYIYFASNRDSRGEQDQVFKIGVDGDQLSQVTRFGGFSAYESPDGRTVYYAKSRYENPEVWEIAVSGGEEKRVSPLLHPSTWANWSLTDKGILFLTEYTQKSSTLEFFDFATQGVRPLGPLENASFWLSSSRDGKSVWYSELTDEQAHLVFKAGMD